MMADITADFNTPGDPTIPPHRLGVTSQALSQRLGCMHARRPQATANEIKALTAA